MLAFYCHLLVILQGVSKRRVTVSNRHGLQHGSISFKIGLRNIQRIRPRVAPCLWRQNASSMCNNELCTYYVQIKRNQEQPLAVYEHVGHVEYEIYDM